MCTNEENNPNHTQQHNSFSLYLQHVNYAVTCTPLTCGHRAGLGTKTAWWQFQKSLFPVVQFSSPALSKYLTVKDNGNLLLAGFNFPLLSTGAAIQVNIVFAFIGSFSVLSMCPCPFSQCWRQFQKFACPRCLIKHWVFTSLIQNFGQIVKSYWILIWRNLIISLFKTKIPQNSQHKHNGMLNANRIVNVLLTIS